MGGNLSMAEVPSIYLITYRTLASIVFKRTTKLKRASAYFGVLPVPRNASMECVMTSRTVPTLPRLIAYLSCQRYKESRLKRQMFSKGTSRLVGCSWRNLDTRRPEQSSFKTFSATMSTSSTVSMVSTQSSSFFCD